MRHQKDLSHLRRPLKSIRLADGRFTLLELREGRAGGPRLVCLPYAGGGPLAFRALAASLPREWQVWGIDPPGHVRTKGDPHTAIPDLVAELIDSVPEGFLQDAILLGHSLGGCVARELAVALEDAGVRVRGVVISGTKPPAVRETRASELDDAGLLSWLERIGQTSSSPHELELFEVFKGALRADLTCYDDYQPGHPLHANVLMLGGTADPMCEPGHFRRWADHGDPITFDLIEGGHFFLEKNPDALADRLVAFAEKLDLEDLAAVA